MLSLLEEVVFQLGFGYSYDEGIAKPEKWWTFNIWKYD